MEENTETLVEEKEVVESGKTFTQDEVDHLIESRLARAKKQMPSKEEIEAFKQWKEGQKTEAERLAQREKEFHDLISERETIKRENIVLRSNVIQDDIDYVLFKVSKLDGDFEENLKVYLADNPKHLITSTVKNTGVVPRSQVKKEEGLGFLSIIKQRNPNVEFKE